MLTENPLLEIIASLIALSCLGCAGTPELSTSKPALSHQFAAGGGWVDALPLPSLCPYADVYVEISTNGAPLDGEIAERVQHAFSDHLGTQGFRVVSSSDAAYWSAFSLVSMNRQASATFAWSVYMMATQDLGGRLQAPFRFAVEGDEQSDLSGFMLLKEVHLHDLDVQTRIAAETTAAALLPHASRMCIAWTQDEQLREELAQEILRVREQRQRKRLRLDTDSPSDS